MQLLHLIRSDSIIAWLHDHFHFKQWPFDKQGHYCAIWSDRRSEENQENPSGHEKQHVGREKKTQKHEWEHSARCTTLRFSQVRVTLATMIPLLWPFDLLILWSFLLCLCSSPTPLGCCIFCKQEHSLLPSFLQASGATATSPIPRGFGLKPIWRLGIQR